MAYTRMYHGIVQAVQRTLMYQTHVRILYIMAE